MKYNHSAVQDLNENKTELAKRILNEFRKAWCGSRAFRKSIAFALGSARPIKLEVGGVTHNRSMNCLDSNCALTTTRWYVGFVVQQVVQEIEALIYKLQSNKST